MSAITMHPKVNRLELAALVRDTPKQAVALGIPTHILSTMYPEQAVSAPAALPIPREQPGIIDKLLSLVRRLRRSTDPPSYPEAQATPTENPYDRTFSGHLMVRL